MINFFLYLFLEWYKKKRLSYEKSVLFLFYKITVCVQGYSSKMNKQGSSQPAADTIGLDEYLNLLGYNMVRKSNGTLPLIVRSNPGASIDEKPKGVCYSIFSGMFYCIVDRFVSLVSCSTINYSFLQ
jgi:hypothetical protein